MGISEYAHLYPGWRSSDPPPIKGKSGELWKKAGGKTGLSPRRSNWSKRFFKIEGPMLQYYDTPALSSMSGLKTTDGNEVDDSNEADTTARKPIWEAHIASAKVDSESGVLICGVGFDKKAQRDVLEVSP